MSEIALGFTEFHVSGQSSEAEDTASSCAAARAQEHKKIPTFTTGTAPVLRSGRRCERLAAVSQYICPTVVSCVRETHVMDISLMEKMGAGSPFH